MDFQFDFLTSQLWRGLAFGIAASVGFSFIISSLQSGADAQTPSRQSAGTILIIISWIVAGAFTIAVFKYTGFSGGIAALLIAPIIGAITAFIAKPNS